MAIKHDSTVVAEASSLNETRERILDAAEQLFADEGFQGVSLRQITGAAGVNLAAVNYHFGSREALVSEVFVRVLGPINQERLRLLDALETEAKATGKPIEVGQILEAAFRPVVIDMPRSQEATRRFLKLAGHCLGEKPDHSPEIMQRVIREGAMRFVAALRRALPHLSETDVFWRLHLAIGALLHALTQEERLKLISNGACGAADPEETMAQLIAFTVAGMQAPAPMRAEASAGEKRRTGAAAASATCLAVLLGLSTVGCAGTPPPDATDQADFGEIPAAWQGEEKPSVGGKAKASGKEDDLAPLPIADRDWVARFRDDRLEVLVAEALGQNKDLAMAAARLEMAMANAKIAGADLGPQAQGVFRGSRQKRNFIGFPFGGDPAGGGGGAGESILSNLNNEFSLSLDLSWEIDLWGRLRAGQSAAISEWQATEADRAAAELSIAGQVAKAWFALQEAREQAALAESTLAVGQKTEQAVRDRFEAGIAEAGQNQASQLRLTMVDVETARANLESRRESVNRAARMIEVLLGRYPAAAIESSGGLPAMPASPPAGMPGDLLDRRPDLHASERRLASADQRLVEARRALLPAISLSGSTGTSTEQIDQLLNSDFGIWSLAGNAVQPLLNGGRLRQGLNLRKGEVKQATAEFEKTVLTAFAEVENALAAEKSLAVRERSLRNAADLAQQAYDSASDEFKAGTGDILTMLTAQDRLFLQKSHLITLRRERLDNRVDLHLALGGGFSTPHPSLVQAAP